MTRSRYSYGPIRQVVESWPVPNTGGAVRIEKYECGHEWRERQDMYGATSYGARRCWQCREGKPVVPYDEIDRSQPVQPR